jgi:hypothetical protein
VSAFKAEPGSDYCTRDEFRRNKSIGWVRRPVLSLNWYSREEGIGKPVRRVCGCLLAMSSSMCEDEVNPAVPLVGAAVTPSP